MRDIVERLRERPSRHAAETEDQAKERRQRDREEAADYIEIVVDDLNRFRNGEYFLTLNDHIWQQETEIRSMQDTIATLRAEVERLRVREKNLTLEGLSLIGRLEIIREALAGTDIGSLPNDYPTERMAQDRMAEIERLRDELSLKSGWLDAVATDLKTITHQRDKLVSEVAAIRALKGGTWKCPINHEGCTKNCGSYGCGN